MYAIYVLPIGGFRVESSGWVDPYTVLLKQKMCFKSFERNRVREGESERASGRSNSWVRYSVPSALPSALPLPQYRERLWRKGSDWFEAKAHNITQISLQYSDINKRGEGRESLKREMKGEQRDWLLWLLSTMFTFNFYILNVRDRRCMRRFNIFGLFLCLPLNLKIH